MEEVASVANDNHFEAQLMSCQQRLIEKLDVVAALIVLRVSMMKDLLVPVVTITALAAI